MQSIRNSIAIGVTLLGFGCASSPAPTEQLASTEASVRAAQELGATRVPRAKLHLRLAQPQVQRGRVAVADGLLAGGGLVDLRQRQGDLDQLLAIRRRTHHLSLVLVCVVGREVGGVEET